MVREQPGLLGFCGAEIFTIASGKITGALDFSFDADGVVNGFAVRANAGLFFLRIGHGQG